MSLDNQQVVEVKALQAPSAIHITLASLSRDVWPTNVRRLSHALVSEDPETLPHAEKVDGSSCYIL